MAELKHCRWNDIELEQVNPHLSRRLIVGSGVMLAQLDLKKDCLVPLHSHVNEQLSWIIKGALRFRIDGREIVVSAGEVLCIPPNMPHEALALEDTTGLDVFTPPRQDWMSKTDAYLRQQPKPAGS
jgi:quercetin dioxygenase-like cupin family protein